MWSVVIKCRQFTYSNYFTITSLTRTVEHQKRFSRINRAATKGISSHNYGCSFDISYVCFFCIKENNKELQRILEGILLDMRNEGKILLIAENSGKCYHITAIKKTED